MKNYPYQPFQKYWKLDWNHLRFSLVPPAMDQVLAGDLEKSRLSNVKVAFIIGLNEGVLPKKFTDDGILADEDREKIIQNGLKLLQQAKQDY